MYKRGELFIVLGALVATIAWCIGFQRPLTWNNGLGWDGAEYVAAAHTCWSGHPTAAAPFVFRVGAPCLAGLFPDAARGLFVANVVASSLAAVLLWVFLSRHLATKWLPAILTVSFLVFWNGPLRLAFWGPLESVDPWFYATLLLGLLALDNRATAPLWLVPIVGIGALFREVALVLPVALAAREWATFRSYRRVAIVAWPSMLAGAGALILTRLLAHVTGHHYSFSGAALGWLYGKPIPELLLAAVIVFGPMLALPLASPRPVWRHLRARPDHAALLAMFAVLGYIGGSDTERFFYWASPLVLLCVGIALESLEPSRFIAPLALLASLQLVSERVGVTTPDTGTEAPRAVPLLTPLRATWSRQLISRNPDTKMDALELAEYFLTIGGIAFWIRRRSARELVAVRSETRDTMRAA